LYCQEGCNGLGICVEWVKGFAEKLGVETLRKRSIDKPIRKWEDSIKNVLKRKDVEDCGVSGSCPVAGFV
jgi:hypothetical protein